MYAALAAFLPPSSLDEVFGKRLFDNANLLPLYRRLLGTEGRSPFACVGTSTEARAAFILALTRADWAQTLVGQMFAVECLRQIAAPSVLVEEALTPAVPLETPPGWELLFPTW